MKLFKLKKIKYNFRVLGTGCT